MTITVVDLPEGVPSEYELILAEHYLVSQDLDLAYKDSLAKVLQFYRQQISNAMELEEEPEEEGFEVTTTDSNGNLDHAQVLEIFLASKEADWDHEYDPGSDYPEYSFKTNPHITLWLRSDDRHDLKYNGFTVAIVDITKSGAAMLDQDIDGYTEIRATVPPPPFAAGFTESKSEEYEIDVEVEDEEDTTAIREGYAKSAQSLSPPPMRDEGDD